VAFSVSREESMKRRVDARSMLPLTRAAAPRAGDPTGEAFRTEWIDFEHGIRVGNLEPHERITRILKYHVERDWGTGFVTDRWGRGVYWQWICWLPRANRAAKPVSSSYNFGCAKLFISVDRTAREFQSGLQIERGIVSGTAEYPGTLLQSDWDWHRLLAQCRKGTDVDHELARLVRREGFVVEAGDFERSRRLDAHSFRGAADVRAAFRAAPPERWASFQLYYPMPEKELRACSGPELVLAVRAAFQEVVPVMNACMQVPLERAEPLPSIGRGGAR
jgi:hypothetical protein